MCPENLDLDQATLIESLEEYYRSRFIEVHVRIDNRDFNRKLNKIIETIQQTNFPVDLIDLVKERSTYFPIHLPIFWANLSSLLAQLTFNLFNKEGKKFDSLEIAVMSISNVMKYAQYVLVEYLTNAISSEITEKLGFRDIANYIRSYEKYRHEYDMGDK